MSRQFRALSLMMLLLVMIAWAAVTTAQEGTPEATPDAAAEATVITDLSYNSPVTGRISDAEFVQTWPLTTASADRVTVIVERESGNLIPSVVIQDTSGIEVASSHGADYSAAKAVITNFTLPIGGQYQVQVGRNGGETGVTEGSYRLTVVPEATAPENINNMSIVGEVMVNTPIEGELTATHWYQRYTYIAPAADTIRIIAERTSGTLIPEVEVLDANGNVLSQSFVDAVGNRSVLDNLTLPGTGRPFTVAITRYGRFTGETEGGYTLTVELIGSGEGSPDLEGVTGEVEYDAPLVGEITPFRWYQDWTLIADAGDEISILVERADEPGATLQPEVIVLGGSDQEIAHGYTGATGSTAGIQRFTLPSAGRYTIRVTRESLQTGPTSGAYTLTVALLGSGEDSPALAAPTGVVTIGEPVEGEVTNRRWADAWTYQGTAEEAITITVERTGGTLVPLLDIRDSNGISLTGAYYGEAKDSATLTYTVPATAEYQIVVYRESAQSGVTTGTYRLSVTEPE